MRTLLLLFVTACFCARAETNAPPVKDLGGGRMEIGKVLLDRSNRSISFPAAVNMQTGVVEYVVVTTKGKTHESVLRTEAEPFHLHTAMLLLGARTATGTDPAIFFDPKKELPGEKVEIYASWKDQIRRPLQQMLLNVVTKEPMAVSNWVYNGSQVIDGKFLAQQDGSIVSLIADASALINNPREDRENDELWVVNTNRVPAVGTEVQVTIELRKAITP
jgi:hypothetical protein